MSNKDMIASIEIAVAHLEREYDAMPVAEFQTRRAAAMDMCRSIINDDNSSSADFNRAHDLITEIDRIGY